MRAVLSLLLAGVVCVAAESSYDELYLEGVDAYSGENWKDTIAKVKQSVKRFSQLEKARQTCYSRCSQQRSKVTPDISGEAELQFFNTILQRSHCVRRCLEEGVGPLPRGGVPQKLEDKMKRREPLYYLQMALHKEGLNREAARTFSQYYYHNPHDQNSRSNFVYYSALKEVYEDDLRPLTTFPYRESFMAGDEKYHTEKWEEMVELFERALPELYSALDQCRRMCEGPLRYTGNLGLYQTVSKVHLDMADCQASCPQTLGKFRKDKSENFFGSIFNYLQYGYYHLNQTDKALQAAAAQLRADPLSESSQLIAKFYRDTFGSRFSKDSIREDVLSELLKHEAVVRYRNFLDNQSGHVIQMVAEEGWAVGYEGQESDAFLLERDIQRFPIIRERYSAEEDEEQPEPVVVQTADDYDGLERLIVDKLLTQQQCEKLMHLATFGKEGDGYNHKSPHTRHEAFVGLHVLDAAKKASYGEVDPSLSWLYVNASRWSKDTVSKVFNLKQPLYFSYTHLVCRNPLKGQQDGRSDLSHPVHSDNCILDDYGECHKVPPAYTWRDYSALLYLNGDFEGGEFFYAHSSKDLSPDVLVKPQCGRLVGFSAGKENMHGVKAVTEGKRCAVALWFTLDPQYSEGAFDQAADLLASLP